MQKSTCPRCLGSALNDRLDEYVLKHNRFHGIQTFRTELLQAPRVTYDRLQEIDRERHSENWFEVFGSNAGVRSRNAARMRRQIFETLRHCVHCVIALGSQRSR
jgi:hypothetical protein